MHRGWRVVLGWAVEGCGLRGFDTPPLAATQPPGWLAATQPPGGAEGSGSGGVREKVVARAFSVGIRLESSIAMRVKWEW